MNNTVAGGENAPRSIVTYVIMRKQSMDDIIVLCFSLTTGDLVLRS